MNFSRQYKVSFLIRFFRHKVVCLSLCFLRKFMASDIDQCMGKHTSYIIRPLNFKSVTAKAIS